MKKLLIPFSLAVIGTSLLTGCADMTVLRTKELRSVEADLRGRLDSLQAAIDSLMVAQERVARRIQADLSAMQRTVREGNDAVTARIEENTYSMEQLRMQPSTTAVAPVGKKGKKAEPQPVAVDPAAAQEAELSKLYATARADFNAQNYKAAFQNFKEVYERAPEGARAEDAMYWMALCYERTGQGEPAVLVYQQLLSAFPQGKKSCSARFQLARLAEEQNKPEERQTLLKELVAEPACVNSNEGRRAAALLAAP